MNDVPDVYEVIDEQSVEGAREEPSYEADFLRALIEEEALDNVRTVSAEDHEIKQVIIQVNNEERRPRTQHVRHTVWNRYWRPGRPLKVQVGASVAVEHASYPTQDGREISLPNEPRSVIGKRIKAERERAAKEEEERIAREIKENAARIARAYGVSKKGKTGLHRW